MSEVAPGIMRALQRAALFTLATAPFSVMQAQPPAEPDGVAGATEYAEPEAAPGFDTQYESELLPNTRQLVTAGARSGEGYFSDDGSRFVCQAEMPGNPFYPIYLMDLESEEASMVSTGIGLTTCAWIHPTLERVMYASRHR